MGKRGETVNEGEQVDHLSGARGVEQTNRAGGVKRAAPVVQSDDQPADAESGNPSQREHALAIAQGPGR